MAGTPTLSEPASERAARASESASLEFIPGTELTAEQDGNELHILGYFLDTQNQRLLTEIARFELVRQNRIREMVLRLNQMQVPLTAESVFALANCRAPGRPPVVEEWLDPLERLRAPARGPLRRSGDADIEVADDADRIGDAR